MLVLGCCVPSGKIIILEALAVVQISFFSVLQFGKIPPTFVGLKSLGWSSGYNDGGLVAFGGGLVEQSVYKLMGLGNYAVENFNFSLVVFVVGPVVVGVVGKLVVSMLLKPI